MNLKEFRDDLEMAKDTELLHYVQHCLCLTIAEKNPKAETHVMLDLVYAECTRRGKERLYDKAYETVCRKPEVCKIFLA